MEEIKITKNVSNTAICEVARKMQEYYPDQAIIMVSEGFWNEKKAELLDMVQKRIKARYELDWFNNLEFEEISKVIEKIKAEVEENELKDFVCNSKRDDCSEWKSRIDKWLEEHDKKIRAELLDKVMQKRITIIDDDGVMYKVVFLKDIEEMKADTTREGEQ